MAGIKELGFGQIKLQMPINHLTPGTANFFCEELDDKYLLPVGHMVSVVTIQLCHISAEAATYNVQTNEHVYIYVSRKFYSWMLYIGSIMPNRIYPKDKKNFKKILSFFSVTIQLVVVLVFSY